MFELFQLYQTFWQRLLVKAARVRAVTWMTWPLQWWKILYRNQVVIVNVSEIKQLLCDTFEEGRPKKTGKTCLWHVNGSITIFVKTIKDDVEQTDHLDVVELLNGNFPILIDIKVGNQNGVNLVMKDWLCAARMQEVAVKILLEGIPWSSCQKGTEHLERERKIKKKMAR